MNTPKLIILTGLTFVLPLLLWRLIYPISDWSVLFLLITFATLFIGGYLPAVAVAKAQVQVAVLKGSGLSHWYTGQLRGVIIGGLFSLVATPILAWQALVVAPQIAAGFLILGLVVCFAVLWAEEHAGKHLTPPFAQSVSLFVGSIVPLILFIPFIAWLNWSSVGYDGAYQTANLQGLIDDVLNKASLRDGWLGKIIKVFYVIDTSKTWLIVQVKDISKLPISFFWVSIFYSVYIALVSVIVARACAYLLIFVRAVFQYKESRK